MTFIECKNALLSAGLESAEWEASLLFEKFANVNRSSLKFENPNYDGEDLILALEKRLQNEPLQYILGEANFYRETYFVNENVLIPRQDTERLVEEAIALLPNHCHFLDLCCGSGCIGISVLANRKDVTCTSADLSEKALEITKINAQKNHVSDRLAILKMDALLEEIPTGVQAILSNPPYIQSSVIPTLSKDVQKEPLMALDGGEDGLIFYKSILKNNLDKLKKDDYVLFEIGYDQEKAILNIAENYGFYGIVKKDYGGNPRVAVLQKR